MVSHRAVAARAGLPLAATTYYFGSLADLVEAAMEHVAQQWLDAATTTVQGLPDCIDDPASVLLQVVAPSEEGLLTTYERYLEAGRSPQLRVVVARFNGQVDALVAEVLRRAGLPADDARLVLAVLDGAVLRALAEGLPVETAREPVSALLRLREAATRGRDAQAAGAGRQP